MPQDLDRHTLLQGDNSIVCGVRRVGSEGVAGTGVGKPPHGAQGAFPAIAGCQGCKQVARSATLCGSSAWTFSHYEVGHAHMLSVTVWVLEDVPMIACCSLRFQFPVGCEASLVHATGGQSCSSGLQL